MQTAKIKKYYPGANSAYGFFSFYHEMIKDDATRILIIKGGPGAGKSTFMRKIAAEVLEQGLNVEYHCCSSDNDSLDGIVIPDLRVACIDGTAPHIVDPRYPGVVDEIINLGEYWDERALREHRAAVIQTTRECSRLFRRAYSYLAAAKIFRDEVEGYYSEDQALDASGLDRLALRLVEEIFGGSTEDVVPRDRERHMFAAAITPGGYISQLATLIDGLRRRYIVDGDDGTGQERLIEQLKEAALMRGFYVEIYHCALDPHRIEHIVIPALDLAVLTGTDPYRLSPRPGDMVISTDRYARPLSGQLSRERQQAREQYRHCIAIAVGFLAQAKQTHDQLEKNYIPHMQFEQIEACRQRVMMKILAYAAEQGKLPA